MGMATKEFMSQIASTAPPHISLNTKFTIIVYTIYDINANYNSPARLMLKAQPLYGDFLGRHAGQPYQLKF